jgi:uncharacterized membrane protein
MTRLDREMAWSHPYNIPFLLLLVLGLLGLLFLAFRFASAPSARSRAIIALRAAAIGALVLILLNPTRVQETSQIGPQPSALLLLDQSRSMSLEAPRTRAQTAFELIQQGLARLPAGRRPPIRRFGFGREVSALSDNDNALIPAEDETRLNRALEQLASRFGDGLPFGVFVFSDGRSTDAEPVAASARAYRALGVPVHVVTLGDERISGDVAISDIDAPRDARGGTRVPVKVTLRSRGFAGKRAELSIRLASNPSAEPIATLPLTLSELEQTPELVLETNRAKGLLLAEITTFPHEAVTSNNSVAFQISPRESTIRVIYMEGTGNQEYRFLEDALNEDPDIKCMSMIVGNQYDARPGLSRIDEPGRGFPTTREELFGYDVVICSDIARTAFTAEQLEWTVELVAKRGGGFAMIGGNTSFGSGGWDQTVWDGLIPVDMSGRGPERSENYWGTLRVVVPPQAIDHPIWRIVDDPAHNRQLLASLPIFYGTNLIDRLKPAATALGLSQGPLSGSRVATVFSCQTFGRGRTFAMASDTTLDWGRDFEHIWGEGDNRYFRRFWKNVVRWLAENSEAGQRRLRVETDKVIYRGGQDIEITAKAYDDQSRETNRYRLLARLRGPGEHESKAFDETAKALAPIPKDITYHGKLPALEPAKILANAGSTLHKFSLDVAALDGNRVVAQSSVQLQSIDDPAEFHDPRPDHALLLELARATGGSAIKTPEELANALGRHPNASVRVVVDRWPVWDHPLLWLLLLGFLAGEWVVRRRRGLA